MTTPKRVSRLRRLRQGASAAGLAVVCALLWALTPTASAQLGREPVALDADDIGGVVAGPNGAEAGVWVIAETTDLPTKFARIVVTDDAGRYLLPDMPPAAYNVWVRGYGLVDSAKVLARPGEPLDLNATPAPTPQAAAQYYPPNYWLSIMELPEGPDREAGARAGRCGLACHQMGGKATREISPETTAVLGPFESTAHAWQERVKGGPTGAFMSRFYERSGASVYPAWTDKILAGAVPPRPLRPRGVERNLVVTLWDWGAVNGFVHDQAPADRRNPVVPPGTLIYGPSQSHDMLVWLDPLTHDVGEIKVATRDTDLRVVPRDGLGGPFPQDPSGEIRRPSPYWPNEEIWNVASEPRSGQMDHKGRIWAGFRIRRDEKQPAFCRSESTNAFARYYPLDPRPNSNIGGKQTGFYDPETEAWTLIDVCWWFDHSYFASDADHTLYSGMNNVVGWLNTRLYDETGNEQASQGWCPAVLDTNGDGTITEWTEPDDPFDPTKDMRIDFTCYSVASSPIDHAAWCNGAGPQIVRIERGSDPPATCKAERYEVPLDHPATGARGLEVDSHGIVWVNFTNAEYMGSFDRSKCAVLNGPTATGQHCPEGWTFYRHPTDAVPNYEGTTIGTDRTYLINVDQFDTLGLGPDVPITYPENADALIAWLGEEETWVTLRVPYPMGAMFTKKLIGRIDDPLGGWKGRGMWSSTAHYAPWHIEGGKGTRGKLIKYQVRPDPLAK
ncbi:MAG: carboxypeptidase-like regulatory domain-containing protein [bacterium]